MSKIFALLAIALISSGAVLLAVPRPDPAARSLSVNPETMPPVIDRAREIAEEINAPLSILFGLVSLYYTRRTYHVNKARAEAEKA